MGIDHTALYAVLKSQNFVTKKDRMLTLGRQHVHISHNHFNTILKDSGIDQIDHYHKNSEVLFNKLGFRIVDSMDASPYEDATIIHDLNQNIEADTKYDYIYDGGTTEHVFNAPQVLENIVNLLSVGGIVCSVSPNNNMSGHGFYQFSPEFFLSSFTPQYGMELMTLHIAQVGSSPTSWIDVKSYADGRNTSSFDNTNPVYIISIAKKISENRDSFITNSPQQYSYKCVDWNSKV